MGLFQRNHYSKADANSWERIFGKIISPLERFAQSSTSSGLLLLVLTLLALLIANSPLHSAYEKLLHLPLGLSIGHLSLLLSLHHWINDGLMAIFFYLVGLEIKREMLVGELASFKQAILPIMAALGGMLVPALFFSLLNGGGPGAGGWGIPMATDIAFALAVLLLLGDRIPSGVMTILLALAIVDDLGAVVVIALFYTDSLNWGQLGAAAACFCLLLIFNLGGIRATTAYLLVSLLMWLFMLHSGIHATIAGVLSALATPVKSLYRPEEFSREGRKLLDKLDVLRQGKASFIADEHLNHMLHSFRTGIDKAQPPLVRLAHGLHNPVYFLIIPLFVLFNAGVHLDGEALHDLGHSPVAWGVALGLVGGKFVGVCSAILICVKTGLAALPSGVRYRHIVGMGLLAGIGFTMSIFIAELAFGGQPLLLTEAKISILLASLCAGLLGFIWLYLFGGKKS